MDSLTHTVMGACLGEGIAGKKLGKKAMLIGALANNLPDIDVITALWTNPAEELLVHRGITHSILFACLAGPILAYVFQKLLTKNPMSFRRWLVLIQSGLFIHIIIDAFTAYGTGWFEPFSNYRVSFNTLFILDPLFSLPMIIAAVLLLFLKKDSVQKRGVTYRLGLGLSALYLMITLGIKLAVNSVVSKDLSANSISYNSYMATPTALNNVLWYAIAKKDDHFYIGYYSIFDTDEKITWELFTQNDSLLNPFKTSEEVAYLKRFSKDYYCLHQNENGVVFSDMRFGQIGGWYIKQAPFVFNFNLTQGQDNKTNLQQGRFKSFNSKDLSLLFDRIKGVED